MQLMRHAHVADFPNVWGHPATSGKLAAVRRCAVCADRRTHSQAKRPCPARISLKRRRNLETQATTMQETVAETPQKTKPKTLLCTSVTASTFVKAVEEIREISAAGADLIELRLDLLTDFDVERHLQQLLNTTDTPKLVTMRPVREG